MGYQYLKWFVPGAIYFGCVFAVGFVLGTIRVLIVVPRTGERTAELVETPLMLLASFLAARWVIHRFQIPAGARNRLPIGLLALLLLAAGETLVVLYVRNESPGDYVAGRDPLSGGVYALALVLFGLMPWLVPSPRSD